jgi:hypothetical protein
MAAASDSRLVVTLFSAAWLIPAAVNGGTSNRMNC